MVVDAKDCWFQLKHLCSVRFGQNGLRQLWASRLETTVADHSSGRQIDSDDITHSFQITNGQPINSYRLNATAQVRELRAATGTILIPETTPRYRSQA
jgi:hypothetical protein